MTTGDLSYLTYVRKYEKSKPGEDQTASIMGISAVIGLRISNALKKAIIRYFLVQYKCY